MKVSVVTLSFNQAAFLERALRSVIEQDYGDVEYIVVDPGSTDGSRDIIARYRDRIARVVEEPDAGPADGLNKGFALATGEVYAYLNADDVLLPGAIREAVEALRHHPEADVVIGHGFIVDAAGKVLRRFRSAPFTTWRSARGAAVAMQQSTFFRASAFRAAGGFNVENRTSWDAELLLEMALAGARVRIVEGDWSLFTVHADSITGTGRLSEAYLADCRRCFRRATGRSPRPSDRVSFGLARLWRWITDPRGLWERVRPVKGTYAHSLTSGGTPVRRAGREHAGGRMR